MGDGDGGWGTGDGGRGHPSPVPGPPSPLFRGIIIPMRKLFALTLLVIQGLGGAGVVVAHAVERPGAPAALDTQQHDGRCAVVHDAVRCAVCHAPGALIAPGAARLTATPAPARRRPPAAADERPPASGANPAAPPRAPPASPA